MTLHWLEAFSPSCCDRWTTLANWSSWIMFSTQPQVRVQNKHLATSGKYLGHVEPTDRECAYTYARLSIKLRQLFSRAETQPCLASKARKGCCYRNMRTGRDLEVTSECCHNKRAIDPLFHGSWIQVLNQHTWYVYLGGSGFLHCGEVASKISPVLEHTRLGGVFGHQHEGPDGKHPWHLQVQGPEHWSLSLTPTKWEREHFISDQSYWGTFITQ